MARQRKVVLHISLFDWRVAALFGFLAGIVVATAPQYIGLILLLGLISGTLVLVSKGRI